MYRSTAWLQTLASSPALTCSARWPPSAALRLSHLQDGRFHLRVFLQAVLPNGQVDMAQDVTLICPKADHVGTPDPYLAPPTTPQPFTPQHFTPQTFDPRPNSGHTLAGSGHTLLSTSYPEHSFINATPPPPSPGPRPAGPTVPHPQWGTLGPWGLPKLESVGTCEFCVHTPVTGTLGL